ncbi:MAG TPA: VCBS repeat-containing protein [Anaeromyxobacter sp.]
MSPGRVLAAAVAACMGMAGCIFYLNPRCDDAILNGHETDVDCGGTCPARCALGRGCGSAADCKSGNCVSGMCVPMPCVNGVQDGAETDVDCGGGTCRKCSGGRHCLSGSDCFDGKCDPGTSTCSSLRTVSFADAVSYGSGLKTYVLASGDLDGDGLVDLVAANEEEDSITVFLGLGDGTFQRVSATNFPTGAYPTGLAIADFDGDGIPDVVTANYHGESVSVLFGAGDGTLGAASTYPTEAGSQTSNLALGDLNGDGWLDVVATNPATGSVSVFLGRPGGALDPSINLPVANRRSAPFSAAIGDFDGDGKGDVAIADMVNLSIVVRLGKGDGTFAPEVAFPEGGVPPYNCIAWDVNLDGVLDVVCANRQSDDVSVLLGAGDGTFGDPIVSSVRVGPCASLPCAGPYSVAVADFNLDGVPDVVTANFLSGTASVLIGIGDGRFEAPIDAGKTGAFSYGVATGDFDRNGKPDFAVCNAIDSDVAVKLSTSF